MSMPEHGKYEWLPILYDFVKVLEPKKIVEFGPGRGVTTIIMAQALRDNNIEGHINSYDIWDNEYWGGQKLSQSEYKVWDVSDYITLTQLDFYDWIKTDEDFDFLYFDINNTGEKLKTLYQKVKNQIDEGAVVFFEGGSEVRDLHGHDGSNMNDIKEEIGYKVLTDNIKYSASAIYNNELYNLEF
jgi:predicted O-methyltransferase YrrM|tara:strand:- start:932 stop:1486 length:555 start_codon:yes stop_codon:yes gene_type:complete